MLQRKWQVVKTWLCKLHTHAHIVSPPIFCSFTRSFYLNLSVPLPPCGVCMCVHQCVVRNSLRILHVCANVWLSSLSLLSSPPALAELQLADLITSEECKEANEDGGEGLSCVHDMVRIQIESGKSHEVMTKTAEVLRSYGFERQSEFISGTYV